MFWPQFVLLATAAGLLLASDPAALAQKAPAQSAPVQAVMAQIPQGVLAQTVKIAAPSVGLLAEVSAEAGIPYVPAPKPNVVAVTDDAGASEARLCVRAGLGLSVPMMAGPQMTVEHGLIGCPTNTGGLPVVVLQDPVLQPPPSSRTGDYNLDVTVRYRLLRLKHLQVFASASDQGVGYSLNSPVSGNNLLLAMSLVF